MLNFSEMVTNHKKCEEIGDTKQSWFYQLDVTKVAEVKLQIERNPYALFQLDAEIVAKSDEILDQAYLEALLKQLDLLGKQFGLYVSCLPKESVEQQPTAITPLPSLDKYIAVFELLKTGLSKVGTHIIEKINVIFKTSLETDKVFLCRMIENPRVLSKISRKNQYNALVITAEKPDLFLKLLPLQLTPVEFKVAFFKSVSVNNHELVEALLNMNLLSSADLCQLLQGFNSFFYNWDLDHKLLYLRLLARFSTDVEKFTGFFKAVSQLEFKDILYFLQYVLTNQVATNHITQLLPILLSKDKAQNNAVHYLAGCFSMKEVETLKILIKDYQPYINVSNGLGQTPLHFACLDNEKKAPYPILEWFIDLGATKSINKFDDKGRSPLTLAVAQGNVAVVELLLKKGGSPWSKGRQCNPKDARNIADKIKDKELRNKIIKILDQVPPINDWRQSYENGWVSTFNLTEKKRKQPEKSDAPVEAEAEVKKNEDEIHNRIWAL